MTGCGIISSVKESIKLPTTTRHRRDITEKLLKAMLNNNSNLSVSCSTSRENLSSGFATR